MSLTAAELRAVYSVDERPLDRSLGGLGGKVSGAVKGAVGAAAGLFAFSQISQGFMGLTGSASDLNETINKSSVIFGANAAQIEQWASGAATNLGLSTQQALAAAAGFGDMFSQIGFAGDQAADMSQKVVQMSADLGSFNNLPTEDVAQRISAAFRGEYDSLQALIPNINAARVESEALAATGKKVASELTAQEKAAAVLAIVNKDGARAMGDFAKTSDGAANAAKIATAEWNDQKAAIGQQLLPVLTSLISFTRSTAIPAIGALAGFIADDVVPAVKDMAQWIDANQKPLLIVAGLIAAVFLPHLIAVGTQSLITGAKSATGWAMQKASAIGAAAVHSAQIAWMIVRWIALGAAAVVQGAVVAAVWTAQVVASAVVGAASFAVQVARVVGGWVLMGTQALIQGARMAAAWLIAMGPVGWVIAAVVGLVALIVANWDTVVAWTQQAWTAAVNFVVGIFGSLPGSVQGVISSILNIFRGFGNMIIGIFTGDFGRAKDGAIQMLSGLLGYVTGIPRMILGALGNLGSLLYNSGKSMIQGLLNGAGSLLSNIGKFFLDKVPSWIRGPFESALGISSPSKVFAGYGENIGQGLVKGMHGMRPAVAAEMLRMADTAALNALTVRRPGGVGAGGGGATAAGGAAAGAAGQGASAAVSTGPMVNIEGDYVVQNDTTPAQTASALGVEVRTRPWT